MGLRTRQNLSSLGPNFASTPQARQAPKARDSDTANQRLSQRRVQAVQAHLQSSGVAAARIRTEACGEVEPRAKTEANANADIVANANANADATAATDDADGQALNRRVRLVLLGDPEQAASTDLRCTPNAATPR